MFDRDTGLAPLIIILIVEGAGIGLTLQPTLVGMYVNGRSEDRAVTTGLRNFIRTIGGAFGLVISGVTLSNTLSSHLKSAGFASDSLIAELTSSTYDLDKFDLSEAAREEVLEVYMLGLHYIFVFFTACAGSGLLLSCWVGNTSLKAPEQTDVEASGDEDMQREDEHLSSCLDERRTKLKSGHIKEKLRT